MKDNYHYFKEKPIIFSTPMVRAILEGRKTMTRRTIDKDISNQFDIDTDGSVYAYIDQATGDSCNPEEICKYQKGDVLYVRETWLKNAPGGITKYFYKADKHPEEVIGQMKAFGYKWRPSIHMPKEAARIWLEVTNVRVERLLDITEEDVIKEGISVSDIKGIGRRYFIPGTDKAAQTPQLAFQQFWDTLNAKRGYGWSVNPWVWVTEFRRVEYE